MRKIERLTYKNERGETVEFSHASVYHTNEVSGLGDIRNEMYTYNSMGQDGDTYLGNRIQSRPIEIAGHINERDKDRMIERRRWLTHVLNPQLSATLTYEYGDFVRVIECRVDNAPVFSAKKTILQPFTVQLICHNPYWRETAESREDIASWIGCFEFPLEIPQDSGIEFAYREPSLIVNVYNGGDVKSGIRVEFRALGTVVNPEIINLGTGEFIRFSRLEMKAGDVVTVSTYYGKKSVTLLRGGVISNAFWTFDEESSYIQLDVGDNLLRYGAESNLEALEVTVYHNNQYLGV